MADFDIVILGTGAGGGTLARMLADTGKKILLLERGPFLPREKENWIPRAVFLESRYKTEEHWLDKEGKPFRPGQQYFVGGNTKVYGAALLRLRKEDFGEVRHFEGISPAWPIAYEEFEPYYLEAEKLYHVHGERHIDPTDPPSSAPYPYPPLSHEDRVQELHDKLVKAGYKPFPLPVGLILDENNRENSPCIRCDTCDGFPCLVDGKADAEVVGVKPALLSSNVTLRTYAKAMRLLTDSTGRKVERVEIETNGKKEEISADLFISSCGSVNSAVLLLRSANSKHPNGLANSSGSVGRHYMCHINTAMIAMNKRENRTLFEKTLGLNDFYFSSPEWNFPLGHIQLLGNLKKDMLKNGAPPFTPDFALKLMEKHTVGWWLCSEDLPDPNNRVRLNANGQIALEYTAKNEEGHKRLLKKLKKILNQIEPGTICIAEKMGLAAVAHQVGTCRFGPDPKKDVLDINCKAHDLDNLYVVDGSFFPSSSAVNPGLTIIANAIRVGKIIRAL